VIVKYKEKLNVADTGSTFQPSRYFRKLRNLVGADCVASRGLLPVGVVLCPINQSNRFNSIQAKTALNQPMPILPTRVQESGLAETRPNSHGECSRESQSSHPRFEQDLDEYP